MSRLPLLVHAAPEAIVAWREDGPRRLVDFLRDVQTLAALMPEGACLLNLCQDRYRFAVGFAAGLMRGNTSLQPSSQTPATFQQLAVDYPGLHCLCDSDIDTAGIPRIAFPEVAPNDQEALPAVPEIPTDFRAAILFTSGSTGEPQAHPKTWGRLVRNGQAEARALVGLHPGHVLVGTVPVQHSYGFESTFLLALQSGCSFWAGKPFFPLDVAETLSSVPAPRVLVTTPFHLSALLDSGVGLPAVDFVLSATATLTPALAARVETLVGAPLLEIYGATECGQLAWRRTTDGAPWTLLHGPQMRQIDGQTLVSGGHVEGEVVLSDMVELLSDQRFLLHGRHADLVNIAGKRSSLAYLNHQIAGIPGVLDAAFFLPDDADNAGVSRLAAFVVAPALTARALQAALRQRVDPLFMPRPLIFVDRLPRNDTGKLPRATLAALFVQRQGHA